MRLDLDREIKRPTILLGHQGQGLIGTIVVQHLLGQADFTEVGSSQLRDVPPLLAYYEGQMLKPASMFYNEERNLLILLVLAPTAGIEWELADMIKELAAKTDAEKVIIPDAVMAEGESDIFYLANHEIKEDLGLKIQNAFLSGLPSALLMEKDVRVMVIMGNIGSTERSTIKAMSGIPSISVAIQILNRLGDILGIPIKTDKLEEQNKNIEKRLEEYINQMQKMRQGPAEEFRTYIG